MILLHTSFKLQLSASWSIHSKVFRHEKMIILRCILQIKPEHPPEKLNLQPLKNLEHPDKKLNSLGIILIPLKKTKASGKISASNKINLQEKHLSL